MADDKAKQPIIIKKKKGGHAGAHGGAWKIAYADFVTAMMAFFMVMWIIGLDVQTKQGIAEYFQNMSARARNEPASPQVVKFKGIPQVKPRIRPPVPRDNNLDKANAEQLSSQIDSLIAANPQLERLRGNLDVKISDTDMRIDFNESAEPGLFVGDGKELKSEAKRLIEGVGAILSRQRHRFTIEGHSDAKPLGRGASAWDQSTERAAAVRTVLGASGILDDRIISVSGFADTKPKFPNDPMNAGNRRVSIVIPYDLPEGEDIP